MVRYPAPNIEPPPPLLDQWLAEMAAAVSPILPVLVGALLALAWLVLDWHLRRDTRDFDESCNRRRSEGKALSRH